ncbi:SLATT domain-containing protein [Glutamicibacter sp. AGC13]
MDNNSSPLFSDERALLLAQIREIYGRIAYVHKTHEKQADICSNLDRRQRGVKVVLTAVSSGAFLVSLSGLLLEEQWAALATSFIAVLVTASSIGDKTFKHGEEMQQHRDTAAKLWSLRESYLSLIVDLKGSLSSVDEIRRRRESLQEMTEKVLADAPRTTPKAYSKAQEGLKLKEDLTFAEREIDLLLPVQLRNGKETGFESDK